MPTTPTTTTHASCMPNRAPASAFATRSPMSTNPLNGVRMPRMTSKNFLTLGSPVPRREAVEPSGDRLDWCGDRREPAELVTARRDPDELDHVDGALNVGQEVPPDGVGARSRRLDRRERVAGRRRIGLGIGDGHSDGG